MKDTLEPIKAEVEPAPLNMLRCNCKTSSKNTCASRMGSCFCSGLKCIAASSNCREDFCNNIFDIYLSVESNIDQNIFDIFEQ